MAAEVTNQSTSQESDLISYELRVIFQVINYVIICGLLSIFGIAANIANIVVFFQQGFKDSTNISLCALAFTDLACVISSLWTSICFNPLFIESGLPFDPLDIMYLTGGYSSQGLSRVTSFITAFITLERCLCVILPLKVKRIITPLRTKLILAAIFLMVLSVFVPFYFVNRLVWEVNHDTNTTILNLVYADNRMEVEQITFLIHSVVMAAVCLLTVIICTSILVVKLNKNTKWRRSNVAQTADKEASSMKDKRVVKMIILISTIFIICFVPATTNFFMMAFLPDFSFDGKHRDIFFVVWSIAYILATTNSSVNIFVYYRMSSKFRVTFLQIFCGGGKSEVL